MGAQDDPFDSFTFLDTDDSLDSLNMGNLEPISLPNFDEDNLISTETSTGAGEVNRLEDLEARRDKRAEDTLENTMPDVGKVTTTPHVDTVKEGDLCINEDTTKCTTSDPQGTQEIEN